MPSWIDGRQHAKVIRSQLSESVQELVHAGFRPPGLHTVIVGNQPASHAYVRLKLKAAKQIGICGTSQHFDADVTEEALIAHIQDMNQNDNVDGILVQLPLPEHIQVSSIIQSIHPAKDVDGFHPQSAASLITDSVGFVPCTPLGCLYLLYAEGVVPQGKNAVVVGRSAIVGRPMAHLLLRENATVTSCHRHTDNLFQHTKHADIVVCATGVPHLFSPEHFKEDAVVIDVGQGRLPPDPAHPDGRLVGDVNKDDLTTTSDAFRITPVPGGVGPMTIAMLLANTVEAQRRQMHTPIRTLRERFKAILPD